MSNDGLTLDREDGVPSSISPDDTTPRDTPVPLPSSPPEPSPPVLSPPVLSPPVLSPPKVDAGSGIQEELHKYFSSSESRGVFAGVTGTAEAGVTWIKWGVAFIVTIFGAGMGYSHWVADNATKSDLDIHIKSDLGPVKHDVSSVRDSVDSLVESEAKRVTREIEAAEEARVLEGRRAELEAERVIREIKAADLGKEMRILEAHRAEYQEAMAEYAATRAEGSSAVRPRKTDGHIALEVDMGILGRD